MDRGENNKMDILPVQIMIASYLIFAGIMSRSNNPKVWFVCTAIILLVDIWTFVKKEHEDISIELTGLVLVIVLVGKCLQFFNK